MPADVQTMFYEGEVPWHKWGTPVTKAQAAAQAIVLAGQDWDVELQEVITTKGLALPHSRATVRLDTNVVLGLVSDQFQVLQNREAFTFFDRAVGEGKAIFHTAGVLGAGEVIWILAHLPGDIRVVGDDVVNKFILLSNAHDGTMACRVGLTPQRVVCRNTLNMALEGMTSYFNVVHRGGFQAQFEEATKVLGFAAKWYEQASSAWQVLARTSVKEDVVALYLDRVFPMPRLPKAQNESALIAYTARRASQERRRGVVRELVEVGQGTDLGGVRGTAWGLYNAVTEWADHCVRGSDSRRLSSMWFGELARIKTVAFDQALALA